MAFTTGGRYIPDEKAPASRPSYWPLVQHMMNFSLVIISVFSLGYHFAMHQVKAHNRELLERIEQLEIVVEPFRCPEPQDNPPEPPTEAQNF
jgi:hypothetical protein